MNGKMGIDEDEENERLDKRQYGVELMKMLKEAEKDESLAVQDLVHLKKISANLVDEKIILKIKPFDKEIKNS